MFATGTSGRSADIAHTEGDRHVTGTVLTFTNVTASAPASIQAIYEREYAQGDPHTVADPWCVLSADHRILSGNRAFYTMFLELASLRTQLGEMACRQSGVPAHRGESRLSGRGSTNADSRRPSFVCAGPFRAQVLRDFPGHHGAQTCGSG